MLNADQIKQIEENSTKQTNIPLFNPNEFFDKTSNNFFGLNTNSIISNLPNPNIFTKDMKFFCQSPPKINLNLNNQETKNVKINNSLNLNNNLNNNINEPKNKINKNSNISTNKNIFTTNKGNNVNNIKNNRQLNNSFNMPAFPSFLRKKGIKKNFSFINEEKTEKNNINSKIMNNNINTNLILSKNEPINLNNIFINPITNNINKIDSIIKYKEPLIVKNPNNNFINGFNSTISKLLFPENNHLSLTSSMNNFLLNQINPLNNNIKHPSMNIPQINNINSANVNASTYVNEKKNKDIDKDNNFI